MDGGGEQAVFQWPKLRWRVRHGLPTVDTLLLSSQTTRRGPSTAFTGPPNFTAIFTRNSLTPTQTVSIQVQDSRRHPTMFPRLPHSFQTKPQAPVDNDWRETLCDTGKEGLSMQRTNRGPSIPALLTSPLGLPSCKDTTPPPRTPLWPKCPPRQENPDIPYFPTKHTISSSSISGRSVVPIICRPPCNAFPPSANP